MLRRLIASLTTAASLAFSAHSTEADPSSALPPEVSEVLSAWAVFQKETQNAAIQVQALKDYMDICKDKKRLEEVDPVLNLTHCLQDSYLRGADHVREACKALKSIQMIVDKTGPNTPTGQHLKYVYLDPGTIALETARREFRETADIYDQEFGGRKHVVKEPHDPAFADLVPQTL